MNGCSQNAGRRGFGVAETVIALMIVAIGLASAMPLVIQAGYAVRRGRDHYVATTIALATLERARNLDVGLLPLLAETRRLVDDQGIPTEAGHFRRSVAVVASTPAQGLTQVTVTVEIMNRRRGGFCGEQQRVAMAYTTY